MREKQQKDDIFILLYCGIRWYDFYPNFAMYRGEPLGKLHGIGVQDDKQHQLNCRHVIQVKVAINSTDLK